jgi:hypothetical protein
MTRTLSELRQAIDRLIQQQGENAPVAAWIYTKEDVMNYPDPDGDVDVTESVANRVIASLDNYDHIYTEIFDCIDDELREMNVLQ